jgi:hypothetical protein
MIHILLILLIAVSGVSQDTQEEMTDIWESFRFLAGSWDGVETGAPGEGKGIRTYEFVLYDKYLHHKNRSEFPPQEKNPDGEVHLDWAFFSYDNFRGMYVMREFHGEGYVNTYAMSTNTENPNTFTFVSEHIENAPPGMRARYTITKVSDDKFTEKFEIAGPGKDFSVLITNTWARATK